MSVVARTSSVNSLQEGVLGKRPIPIDMRRITTMILCGGQGTRLFPLTQTRCKPAMCYGGRYRLIDFPLSNAINSGCRHIFLLTQFLSNSLHKHVFTTYRPGVGSNATIDMLTSEERPGGKTWFRGTADAVRQTIEYTAEAPGDYILVLSGDQIYTMDFRGLMQTALETDADAVVSVLPVTAQETPRMGILQVNKENAIVNFCEKPQTKQLLMPFTLSNAQMASHNISQSSGKTFLGSMGIYLFKKKALLDLLREDPRDDFGKHLIPFKVSQGGIFAHIHQGYWEDIGTIESFYNTNIALTQAQPPFNTRDESWPLFAHTAPLPGATLGNTQVSHAILCEGVHADAKEITHSILGPRTVVHQGSIIRNTYVMGHDFDNTLDKEKYSIGRNTLIDKAIIDKLVTIGSNVRLTNEKGLKTYDSDIAYIRDGIIVIPRGTTIPDGYTL
jgi:glucose-1-phosphate adenylyltransferase